MADDYIDDESVEVNEVNDLANLVVMDAAIVPAAAAKHGWRLKKNLSGLTRERPTDKSFDPATVELGETVRL